MVLANFQARETLNFGRRLGPLNFNPLQLAAGAETEDLAWVVAGKVAATAIFKAGVAFAIDLPGNPGTDGIAIAGLALEFEANPEVIWSGIVLEKKRGFPIVGDQNIDAAIVVVIADGESAGWK